MWLGAVFVALPSANLLLGMIPLILFTIAVMISGGRPPNRPYLGAVKPHYHGITCKTLSPRRTASVQV